jgi:hypothetical protein
MAADEEALRPTRGDVGIDCELPRPLEQRGQHRSGFDAGERGAGVGAAVITPAAGLPPAAV